MVDIQEYINKKLRMQTKKLDISDSKLEDELDLSDFINLEELYCGENKLNHLDLSKCSNLRRIHCSDNLLTNLDLSNCNKLEHLHCAKNQLISLKLPNNKNNLKQLVIHDNKLEQDLSFLEDFNNLEEIYVGGNFFSGSLEHLKKLKKLRNLDISDNNIDSGLEYLPDSVEEFHCYIITNPRAEVEKIYKELQPFAVDAKKECQQPNTSSKWCQPCNAKHFQEEFKNWTKNQGDYYGLGFEGEVALKKLNNSQNAEASFLQEITNHKLLGDGVTVVECYGISRDPKTNNYAIVTKYMGENNADPERRPNAEELNNKLNDWFSESGEGRENSTFFKQNMEIKKPEFKKSAIYDMITINNSIINNTKNSDTNLEDGFEAAIHTKNLPEPQNSKEINEQFYILGIALIVGLITGIYFFTSFSNSNSPTKSPSDNPLPNPDNIQYLPSEEEAQAKINQIKSAKNLDDQQATIEFLTQYVPHINNYQELGRRISEEINTLLSSLNSQFPNLSQVKDLNALMETFLSKFFQGYVYSEIQDDLGKQLTIDNHEKYRPQKTGNSTENSNWGILFYEFAFQGGSAPNPETPPQNSDAPINPPSSNPQIKQLQDQAEEIRQLLKPCEELVNSLEQIKKDKENLITQLEEKKKNLDPNDAKDKIKLIDIETEISKIEHTITMVGFSKDDLEKIKREVNRFEDILSSWIGKDDEYRFEPLIPEFQKSFSECKANFPSVKKALEDFCNN
ncbi:19190_t:CDS:2 [Entrophospora sp. SA101]|nr:19190_t:CDS:2 [Entrophospora sp. SA101]